MNRDISVAWDIDLFESLLKEKKRYVVLTGGRSSGKSYTAALIILLRGLLKQERVLCVREFQASLGDSVKPLMEDLSNEYDLGYERFRSGLRHPIGTEIQFHGLSTTTGTTRSIKSMHGITICYIEEGQFIREASWKVLEPTIRTKDSQFMVSMNPTLPSDILWKIAISNSDNVRRVHINYTENNMLTTATQKSIEEAKKLYPTDFAHIYLGELADDVTGTQRIISPGLLKLCYDLYKEEYEEGFRHAGWDVADEGNDHNCFLLRHGPVITGVERWLGKNSSLGDSTEKSISLSIDNRIQHLAVDGGGLGAGAKSDLKRLKPPFEYKMVFSGGRTAEPDVIFQDMDRQKDRFSNRRAQLAWAVKIRAENTRRLAAGEDVDPSKCLFIRPSLHTTWFDSHLIQPLYDDKTGKIRIDKQTKEFGSPDAFDAMLLAFEHDSRYGLSVGPSKMDEWMIMREREIKRKQSTSTQHIEETLEQTNYEINV